MEEGGRGDGDTEGDFKEWGRVKRSSRKGQRKRSSRKETG